MPRALAFFWTVTLFAQSGEVRNPFTAPADVSAGAKTFRSHCAECHGLNAEGGRGPNLASGRFFHGSSDQDLLMNISNGIAGTEMPGLFYSPDRVWQVIAYLRSLNRPGEAVKGDPAAGEALFRSSGCGGCHRIRGEGGRTGPDLTWIGQARSPQHLREAILNPGADVRQRYWVVEMTGDDGRSSSGFLMNEDTWTVQFMDLKGELHSASKSGLRSFRIDKVSKMPSWKDRLNSGEVDNLVAYLYSLRPGKGEEK